MLDRVLNRLARVMTMRAFASAALLLTCLRPLFASTVAIITIAGFGLCLPLLIEASTDFTTSAAAALRFLQSLRRALGSNPGSMVVAVLDRTQEQARAMGFAPRFFHEMLWAYVFALTLIGPTVAYAAHALSSLPELLALVQWLRLGSLLEKLWSQHLERLLQSIGLLLSDVLVWLAIATAQSFDFGHYSSPSQSPQQPLLLQLRNILSVFYRWSWRRAQGVALRVTSLLLQVGRAGSIASVLLNAYVTGRGVEILDLGQPGFDAALGISEERSLGNNPSSSSNGVSCQVLWGVILLVTLAVLFAIFAAAHWVITSVVRSSFHHFYFWAHRRTL